MVGLHACFSLQKPRNTSQSKYTQTWNFDQVDSLLYLLSDIYLVNEKTKSQVNFISSFFRADMNFRCLQQRAKNARKEAFVSRSITFCKLEEACIKQ